MHKRWLSIALLAAATQASAAPPLAPVLSSCHTALIVRSSADAALATPAPDAIRWRAAGGVGDRSDSAGWCDGVGPAVIAEDDTSTVVSPKFDVAIDRYGSIVLTRREA